MQVAAPPPNVPDKKKWTVMLYSAADNNLQPFMLDDVREIETVGSDKYTNIVAQVDCGGDVGAARYLLGKNPAKKDDSPVASPAVQQLGDVNMSDPQTMADFIEWGMKNYPAENYLFIASDHGNGWRGALEDDSQNGWATLPNLREGLEKGEAQGGSKINVVGFDACLMASAEVAHELKGTADYLVVSQQTEGVDGWAYSRILTPAMLKNMQQAHLMKLDVAPRDLAVLSVKASSTKPDVLPTMSAIDTSKVDGVTAAIDQLGSALAKSGTDVGVLQQVAEDTQDFTGYKDAVDFSQRLINHDQVGDADVKAAAQNVTNAVADAVIAEEHTDEYPGAHGLTLEISTWGGPSDEYMQTKFAQDTHWPDALKKISNSDGGKVKA